MSIIAQTNKPHVDGVYFVHLSVVSIFDGGAYRTRTDDLFTASEAL